MSRFAALRPSLPILLGAGVMLSIGMGLRQSLGIFMQPAVRDLGITVADFTLAMAVQNLAWGFLQPVAGAIAARRGFAAVLLPGVVLYILGLLVMALAGGRWGILIGAGVLVGLALACTASAMANAVVSRPVPAAMRSTVLGMTAAVGSLGSALAAPLGQALTAGYGWRAGVWAFVLLSLAMLPAAWLAGKVDKVPLPRAEAGTTEGASAMAVTRQAIGHWPFMVMTGAYFICGLQLMFLSTHLPSYLDICGMDPMLSAQALGVIGAFNIAGSLFFGWAGGRWNKATLLGLLYIARSFVLAWYFSSTPTPGNTLLFAALMGLLWLGVAPLVAGLVAEMFGLRWQAMVQGLAFTSHQIGSFAGAYGAGLLFDAQGNYDLVWKIGVGIGILAGTVQLLASLPRWPTAPLRAAA